MNCKGFNVIACPSCLREDSDECYVLFFRDCIKREREGFKYFIKLTIEGSFDPTYWNAYLMYFEQAVIRFFPNEDINILKRVIENPEKYKILI